MDKTLRTALISVEVVKILQTDWPSILPGNGDHGSEVGGSFFIAGGNATKLLETIDESFHDISLAVVLLIERTSAPFIATTSNGATNMVTMKILSKSMTGVAFVCHQGLRS